MQEQDWRNVKGFCIVRAGRFPEDCSTAAMINTPPYFYQIRWRHLERYDPQSDEWHAYPGVAILPEVIGPGADITSDGRDYLYISRGGRTYDFWRYDIKGKKIEALRLLPDPHPIGTGSRITYVSKEKAIYALRGDQTYVFLRYDLETDRWEQLTPFPLSMVAPIGRLSTGLVYVPKGRYLLGWTDHHVQKYDLHKGKWSQFAVTFRPFTNGCMVAYYDEEHKVYLVQGGFSMTIGALDCRERKFSYLAPRLPDVVSVEGNRLIVARIKGIPYLYVYRGHNTSEFWRIRMEQLREM